MTNKYVVFVAPFRVTLFEKKSNLLGRKSYRMTNQVTNVTVSCASNQTLLIKIATGKARVEPLVLAFYHNRSEKPKTGIDFQTLEKTTLIVNGRGSLTLNTKLDVPSNCMHNKVLGYVIYQEHSLEMLSYSDFTFETSDMKFDLNVVLGSNEIEYEVFEIPEEDYKLHKWYILRDVMAANGLEKFFQEKIKDDYTKRYEIKVPRSMGKHAIAATKNIG